MSVDITGLPIAPEQSTAVCIVALRTRVALLFDRIIVPMWEPGPIEPGVPKEIGYRDIAIESVASDFAFQAIARAQGSSGSHGVQLPMSAEESMTTMFADLYRDRGINVVPVFSTTSAYVAYRDRRGKNLAYQAALENIPVVEPDTLSWDQVRQFREDVEATRKYRDLKLWLDAGLQATTLQQAIDIIGQKIDDYDWALKKHGVRTVIGALKQLLSWNKAALYGGVTAAAALAGGPLAGAIAGGLLMTADISVNIAEARTNAADIARGENREVAMLLDIQKKLGRRLTSRSS